jgi:hypothetical protein
LVEPIRPIRLALSDTAALELICEAGLPVSHDQFATPGRFDQESQKVDAYWKTPLSNNGSTKANG